MVVKDDGITIFCHQKTPRSATKSKRSDTTDLSPLAKLIKRESLQIGKSQVSDLRPLATLKSLKLHPIGGSGGLEILQRCLG